VIFRGARVNRVVVLEHPRLEVEVEEIADAPQLHLGLEDEVLVAKLEVARAPDPPAQLGGALDFEPPLAGEGDDVSGATEVEARPAPHLHEGEGRVAAVAHEVDVLRAGESPFEQAQALHVGGRLVAEAALALRVGVAPVDRLDRVRQRGPGRQTLVDVLRGHSPFPHAREARQIVEEGVHVEAAAVAVPELRDEVGLRRDGELGMRVEHLFEEGRPAPGDAQHHDGAIAHCCGCIP
jgi:hypothetical protein